MNLNDLSTQLLFTTVPIWTELANGGRQSATAFVYNVPIPSKPDQSVPLLITNHHVVQGAKRALVEFVESDGGKPVRERRVRVEFDQKMTAQYVNAELDVAAIPLGPVLNQLQEAGKPAFFRSITPEIIPTAEVLAKLAAVEEILFIGYPSGLRDETNSNPLVRRGITATPVWNDFQGRPSFLVDAGVFPGSSGSPVFILNQGSYATAEGISIGNRLLFLGMICQSIIRTDAQKETFLGLGQVIRSSALRDFIDEVVQPFLPKS
jgi:trypsin-like peptidase